MNLFKLLFYLLFLCSCSMPETRDNGIIRFNGQEYDFGTIPLKEEVQYGFEFSNPGKTPLVISNVKTSCGCTIPEWPRKPVEPKGKLRLLMTQLPPEFFIKPLQCISTGKTYPLS